MSKQELVNAPAAFQVMKTDIEVSMDDVVSAFVSQYENNLFARKKELGAQIKAVEATIRDNEKAVLKVVNGDQWKKEKLPFGLKYKVGEGEICWGTKTVDFKITIRKNEEVRYGETISLVKEKKIPAAHIKVNDDAHKELDALRSDLQEVLLSLKQVARKERQVRGRIAMRKLEDSGYASLMQDAELMQLVQLDDE